MNKCSGDIHRHRQPSREQPTQQCTVTSRATRASILNIAPVTDILKNARRGQSRISYYQLCGLRDYCLVIISPAFLKPSLTLGTEGQALTRDISGWQLSRHLDRVASLTEMNFRVKNG